jgi:DNA replication protein DnaC
MTTTSSKMTTEELEAALALLPPEGATAPLSAPALPATPAPTRMVVEALKATLEVTTDDLARRMAAKLARADRDAQEHDDRERALLAKRQAMRLAFEPRIDRRLLNAVKAHQTPCALFLGPTGCGKTSAALWVVAAHPYHLVRSRDLASAARRHGLGEGYPPEVEEARARGLLILDDVGAEGSDVATLQDILDHRYSRCYPTIVTTGLTDLALQSHLGAAHYRRILEQHVPRTDGSGTELPVLIVDCHEQGKGGQ